MLKTSVILLIFGINAVWTVSHVPALSYQPVDDSSLHYRSTSPVRHQRTAPAVYDGLRTWSIPTTLIEGKPVPEPVRNAGETVCRGRRWPSYIFLTRPDESNFVAVLEYEPGTAAELYPKGFDYGRIPNLNEFSPSLAALLFAPSDALTNTLQERTYRLTTAKPYALEFFLDLVFENNRLKKYKIRGATFEHFDSLAKDSEQKITNWRHVD